MLRGLDRAPLDGCDETTMMLKLSRKSVEAAAPQISHSFLSLPGQTHYVFYCLLCSSRSKARGFTHHHCAEARVAETPSIPMNVSVGYNDIHVTSWLSLFVSEFISIKAHKPAMV